MKNLVWTLSILISFQLTFFTSPGFAQEGQLYSYSVKFVCGINEFDANQTGGVIVSGGYKTVINVQRASFSGSADISVLPVRSRSFWGVSPREFYGTSYTTNLRGAEVVGILCHDIQSMYGPTSTAFKDGFLRISSTEPLSVVAIYTGKHCDDIVSGRFIRNALCEGEIAMDVVQYEPVIVEEMSKGEPEEPEAPD